MGLTRFLGKGGGEQPQQGRMKDGNRRGMQAKAQRDRASHNKQTNKQGLYPIGATIMRCGYG